MHLRSVGSRSIARVGTNATASDVARKMESDDVGSVVVMDGDQPVGIVTDRDLVVRVMALGRDPASTPIGDVMSSPLTTIADDAEPAEAAALIRATKLRRLGVVDGNQKLVGILTFDDLVHYYGRTQSDLADAVAEFPVATTAGD